RGVGEVLGELPHGFAGHRAVHDARAADVAAFDQADLFGEVEAAHGGGEPPGPRSDHANVVVGGRGEGGARGGGGHVGAFADVRRSGGRGCDGGVGPRVPGGVVRGGGGGGRAFRGGARDQGVRDAGFGEAFGAQDAGGAAAARGGRALVAGVAEGQGVERRPALRGPHAAGRGG